MIIRKASGEHERISKCRKTFKRDPGDFDLKVGESLIYVLDSHEWFDPMTSSKGRHSMYGPALIVVEPSETVRSTTEYHVNDPEIWKWIRENV